MSSVAGWGTPSPSTRTRRRATIRQVSEPLLAVMTRDAFSLSVPAGSADVISSCGSNAAPAANETSMSWSRERNVPCGAAIAVRWSGSPSFVTRQRTFHRPLGERVTASGSIRTRGAVS